MKPTRIDVCVCTCRRPRQLARLLEALGGLQTDGGRLEVEVIVVDNDPAGSARPVLEACRARRTGGAAHGPGAATLTAGVSPPAWPLRHAHEPEPNIARARNRACALASAEFVAMIDDDELPQPDWLLRMLETLQAHRADGVLAPVRPRYEAEPPRWVLRGSFCERPGHAHGTRLTQPRLMRTGNVLIRREVLQAEPGPFDEALGRSGGEDTDFFRRRLARGDTYVWCAQAPVWEAVPAERLTRRYFLRRALLRGAVNARRVRLLSADAARSLAAAVAYTLALPLLWPRQDLFMHALVRDCDHLGKLFALCGLPLVRERIG